MDRPRVLSLLVIFTLVLTGAMAPEAGAKKKKKQVSDSFAVTALPFPNLSSSTGTARPGCSAGVEGVHWGSAALEVPFSGDLRYYIEGFTGDWDIYVFAQDSDAPMGRADAAQIQDMAAPEEEINIPVLKGQALELVVCNWAGAPTIEAHYELIGK